MVKVAFIPAKQKSERIPYKNKRKLGGYPLYRYTIQAAQDSMLFNRIIVVSDDREIELMNTIVEVNSGFCCGIEFLDEPLELTTAPDIEWLQYCRKFVDMDFFAILRPTSPFRTGKTIRRAWEQFHNFCFPADSIRAIEKVKQHPGKMWLRKNKHAEDVYGWIIPLVKQGNRKLATYNSPTQKLPTVYVQNASLEIGRVQNLDKGSVSGERILPFFTEGYEGFDINTPEDWILAEELVRRGLAKLPEIK